MKKLRVFIVEGSQELGILLRNILETIGFSISGQVSSGSEAIALSRIVPTDIVLMNANLPGELRSAEAIRILQDKIGLPVILVTEENTKIDSAQIEEAEPYGYITQSASTEYVKTILQLAFKRCQIERKLKLRNSALNAINRGIIIIDLKQDGRPILYANNAFLKLSGYKMEEVLGKNLNLLKGKETNLDLDAMLSQVDGRLIDFQTVLLNYRRDGSAFWNEVHFSVIHDYQKQITHLVVEMNDVTHKKLWEADALRSHRLESIGRLTMGVAHDLNNILAPILIAAQSLQSGSSKSNSNLLNAVETSVKRGAGIVKQLLGFARTYDTQKVLINVRHLLHDLEKITGETFPKTIEIKCDIPTNLWLVPGDSTQLYQVLLNLLVNARDAMPNGGQIHLSASNTRVDDTFLMMQPGLKLGPYISLLISDTGIGIEPEILDKIFDPFFSTKNPGVGTGLGLYIAHTIIKSMQGDISVKSTLGKGTNFKIFLPAVTEKGLPAPVSTYPLASCPKGNNELILIVDDEATFLQVAQDLLINHGYRVISAMNGMEGLNLYHNHEKEIQLILTDLLMPVMDGFAFIRTLVSLGRKAPIVAITGADTKEKMPELNQLGIEGFLEKPFTTESLLSIASQVLSASKKRK